MEERALRYVAKAGDGSMRDALSLLDQCIAFHLGQELTYDKVLDVLGAVDTAVFSDLLRYVLDRNVLGCIELLEEIVMQGYVKQGHLIVHRIEIEQQPSQISAPVFSDRGKTRIAFRTQTLQQLTVKGKADMFDRVKSQPVDSGFFEIPPQPLLCLAPDGGV